MDEIVIRKTKVKDIKQIADLTNAIWRSAYAHIMPQEIFEKIEEEKDQQIEIAEKRVNKYGRIEYVAVQGDKVVGLVIGKVQSRYHEYDSRGFANLGGLYIDPEYQHLGIGKKLFDKVVEHFKGQGYKKMFLGVLKDNVQARRAYEKWGCKLDDYERPFEIMGYSFPEVFYIFDL